MKKMGICFGLAGALTAAAANAGENATQLDCSVHTRVFSGRLHAEIIPTGGYLTYSLETFHADSKQKDRLVGSNQEGFGNSALSWSSVRITVNQGGQTRVTAEGVYYDRATPAGRADVEIVLEKADSPGLGGHKLVSFKVNGAVHSLVGANHCRFD